MANNMFGAECVQDFIDGHLHTLILVTFRPVNRCFDLVVASGHILIFLAKVKIKESFCFKIALQIKLCTIRNATSLFGEG